MIRSSHCLSGQGGSAHPNTVHKYFQGIWKTIEWIIMQHSATPEMQELTAFSTEGFAGLGLWFSFVVFFFNAQLFKNPQKPNSI